MNILTVSFRILLSVIVSIFSWDVGTTIMVRLFLIPDASNGWWRKYVDLVSQIDFLSYMCLLISTFIMPYLISELILESVNQIRKSYRHVLLFAPLLIVAAITQTMFSSYSANIWFSCLIGGLPSSSTICYVFN